jgi:hypothetical protein
MAQPVNDNCNTATVIPQGDLDDGTMSGNCEPLLGESYVDATPWEAGVALSTVWSSIPL